MDSSIRRLKNATTNCKKAVHACLKSVRTTNVIGSKRSNRARDAATVTSSDAPQQAGSSARIDLPKETALISSVHQETVPTSVDKNHAVVYDENSQSKRRTTRVRRKGVGSKLNAEDVPLVAESGPATENAAGIASSSCSNNEEEPCKDLGGVTVVGERAENTGEVSGRRRIMAKPRKRRVDQSGDVPYAKQQLRVNKPGRIASRHTEKSDRLESIENNTMVQKECVTVNKSRKAVAFETSKAIPNENCTARQKSDFSRATRKAKRMRFLVNGDRFSKGVVVVVTHERYRSFDSLLAELSNILSENKHLLSGVRTLFATDGRKISRLDDLEDGEFYICSGGNNFIKKLDYVALNSVKLSRPLTKLQSANNVSSSPSKQLHLDVRPKIIFVVRSGARPRKIIRILLDKRNSPSFEHVLALITGSIKLDTGAVRKVYMSSGCKITQLEQFFEPDDLFFAYGCERISRDDLKLNPEETKIIESHKRGPRRPANQLKDGTHCTGKSVVGRVPRLPKATKANRNITSSIPSRVLNRYTIGDRLGDGTFAVVYRCFDKRTNSEYALKVIKKIKSPQMRQTIKNELAILKTLNHPNIVRLITETATAADVYLITELVSGGDLFEAIVRRTDFSDRDNRLMTRNLASALAYLHGMAIVHRDVKPENLLVEFDSDGHVLHLKLADFGVSRKVDRLLYTTSGTPMYMAPEILVPQGYGVKIDVWAAGVILYILLGSVPPFFNENDDQEQLFADIRRGAYGFPEPYWDNVSEVAKDLVCSMLQYNPGLRFSAKDVLDHPWCDDNDSR